MENVPNTADYAQNIRHIAIKLSNSQYIGLFTSIILSLFALGN